ncbi:uncharacterized protein LOC142236320 [Haematobia irritans]|uniref:uncharacterized protein LOC142236320 n=1 Tax=Haematobia irritans TaxID=7368 RepID=UPI003F4F6F16
MSISKNRIRSPLTRHNTHHEATATRTTASVATSSSTAATTTMSHSTNATQAFKLHPNISPTNTAELPARNKVKMDQESPKILQKQKSKILPLSTTSCSASVTKTSVQKHTGGGNGTSSAAIAANSSLTSLACINNPAHTATAQTTTSTTITIANIDAAMVGYSVINPHPSGGCISTAVVPTTSSSLLKIEPFVPSLGTRLQKPMRRSYSTLSTTSINKRLHGVNSNLAVNFGYLAANNHHSKTPATAAIIQGTTIIDAASSTNHNSSSSRSKLPKHTGQQHYPASPTPPPHQPLRRRQPVRGRINRQRSKSTSSSNSASNRPATTLVTAVATTPTLGTPCSPPQNAVVIPQPNGICRIQRNVKEQEKLPDRINYDKRGLTAIPIFENETNLRLLSLQHNLINTFHIPKEVRSPAECSETKSNEPSTLLSPNTPTVSRSRFPPPNNSPNHEPSAKATAPPQLSLSNLANSSHISTGGGFGAYTLRRNRLLHRSINLNNVNLQQNGPSTSTTPTAPPPLRFAMRKSKSFINNFNLQYQINKRGQQNGRASFLKKAENSAQLKSFDSSTSTLTTDSTVSTYLNGDIEEEDEHKVSELEIKNQQLLINYGSIFSNLVFLDLYDNQIERIASLDGLTSLTVLLLGKNRITDISGLASLRATLKVLDLHGNKLCSVANKINCLRELKSLNLAGNQIRQINHNDFMGLSNLKELNLKRNKLKRINGFQHLVALERLWLCHNDLHKVDDMSTISQAYNVIEITIENNPVSLAGDCVSFLVSHLPKLQTLSQMPITDQVRKAAMAWRSNKELSEQSSQQGNKEAFNLIRREEIISNARTNWELLRSQQMLHHGGTAAAANNNGKTLKVAKRQNELEKITEANEQSYEEFIKLPPIEGKQDVADNEDRTSSASSLGPNVNSSSSCYTSADDEEELKPNKEVASTSSKESVIGSDIVAKNDELCPTKGTKECSPLDDNTTKSDQMHLSSCSTPTLTIQFPLDETKSSNQSTLMSGGISSSSTMTVGAVTVTRPSTPVSPTPSCSSISSQQSSAIDPTRQSSSLCKRYMTGSLMRSQTIVGSGTVTNGAGYTMKANGHTTPVGGNQINILRYHPAKLNPAMVTTTTSPNHLVSSSLNGLANMTTSSSLNTNKTLSSSNITTATSGATSTKLTAIEREREQGGDYLIEICGRYLNIYGQGALRFIDKQWNPTKASDVHTLNFSYINFNNITSILSRIKVRFPHAENFVFRETNINCLGQINALAELQGITSVFIDPEGNPITQKNLWRQYTIYRLSHWGLKTLNGQEITSEDVDKANVIYAGLSDLILWSMPDAMLQPLLTRLRLDESCTASKMQPKQWLQKPDNRSLRLVVGKEALQWKKSHNHHHIQQDGHILPTPQQIRLLQAQFTNPMGTNDSNPIQLYSLLSPSLWSTNGTSSLSAGSATNAIVSNNTATPNHSTSVCSTSSTLTQRERGKIYFTIMMENTCHAVEKLHKLEQIWPMMLLTIVRNTLLDYSQLDVYIRDLMAEIMK